MNIWLILLLPFLGAIVSLIYFKKQIVWWELCVPVAVGAFIILIFKEISIAGATTDTVYHGALITKARYYEYWESWESRTCSYETCNGYDKNGSCTSYTTHYYDCSYCDENSAYWEAYDTEGKSWSITKQKYEELKGRWKASPAFVELNRKIDFRGSCGKDGNAYEISWNNDIYSSEPSTFDVTYTNKVQATRSAFSYPIISRKEARGLSLYDYPPVNGYSQKSILGLDSASLPASTKDSAQKLFMYLNGKYGHENHVRVYVLLFFNKDISIASKQEAYWIGGNRNELVICIGLSKTKIDWVKSFSWSDNKRILIDSREDIALERNIDFSKAYPSIVKTVIANYKPKDFEDFSYLTVEVPLWAKIVTLILVTIATVVILFFEYKNEYQNDTDRVAKKPNSFRSKRRNIQIHKVQRSKL